MRMENNASLLSSFARIGHDPNLCAKLLDRLKTTLNGRRMRFMEVCGTHTVSIFQSGLRSLLPDNIIHLSGPGCPVCVTHEAEVALFLELAARKDIIIATFGDLLRVPGPNGQCLKNMRAAGSSIAVVYSPLDAIAIAQENPAKNVVFLGIGFETTAPTVAASILVASEKELPNYSVLSLHKLVPPALANLLDSKDIAIDAFLLPGHVAAITGLQPFSFLAADYGKPGVVAGFEPLDLLLALCDMAEQLQNDQARISNAYPRSVNDNGNPRALTLLDQVFQKNDALWRGLGKLPNSGLAIKDEYANFNAMRKFDLTMPTVPPLPGCKCGEVLKGASQPKDCPLFGKKCTPASPVGPCMVSTEGSCAAWFKYGV